MTKTGYLIITIILLIMIRVPSLVSWNKYMTGNDAAVYMEKGIHLAEGKGLTSSICRFMADRDELKEYIVKFGNRTQELKVAPLYIYMISGLYGLVGQEYYLLSINLLNLLLFIATLLVIYFCIVPLFTANHKIGLMTITMVGLNYVFFEGMFGAHLETLSLFLFVCSYAWHSRIIVKEILKWPEILGYAILLSLLFLSKYSSIPFVAAFVLHHLIQRKYYRFISVAFIVAVLSGSWFIIRDILLQGKVISGVTLSPFMDAGPEFLSREYLKNSLFDVIGVARRFIQALFDINGLAFLFPFALVYYAGHQQDRLKQANWLLLITSALFFALYGYTDLRYIYPIFIPLFAASFVIFYRLLGGYSPMVRKAVFITLFAIFAGYQLREMVYYTNAVRKQAVDREAIFKAADELLESSWIPDKASVLTNILGYNVYADIGVVKTPGDLTESNSQELIDLYDIDYVLFCSDQLDTQLAWDQDVVTEDVFTDLPLIAISNQDRRIRLYSTSDFKHPDYKILFD